METAVITTAVPKPTNKAIIITVVATKISVIKVHPDQCLCADASIGLSPKGCLNRDDERRRWLSGH
jgi:hypothetical protein